MDKYTGKRLDGRYEIYEIIGVGGMAVVYRAYDTIDDRIVAIKILKDEYLNNQEFIRRFKNESKAIAVLSHPNIVKVYDVSFGDRIQYIVMEYIDGITLKEYLDQQHEVRWKEAIHFTIQILRALQHAHEKGVVHRDIKPQNIMLLQDGTIKVTDFGIARFCRSETRTMTDKAIGSVHYIAPEQARGDVTDEKADIYSVGVMLYEMLTGQLPFDSDNAVSVAIMQLQTDPTPPHEINPSIPEGLEEIVLHAMEKNPAQRYQSAAEMLQDIEQFRRNPSVRFQYRYFVDEKPTKYIDAIDTVRSAEPAPYQPPYQQPYPQQPARRPAPPPEYDDSYDYEDDVRPARQKSPALMIMLGVFLAFVIAAAGFGAVALVRNFLSQDTLEDVPLPNFVGMQISDVENSEEYRNFTFTKEFVNDATQEAGIIVKQNPSGNIRVKENAEIVLTVNNGGQTVNVPNVVGLTEDDAKQRLREYGLTAEVTSIMDDQTAEGYVKECEPAEGAEVQEGSTVRLFVSRGPSTDEVEVPSVIDKSLDAARADIIAAGLTIGDITYRDDSDKAKDTVLETDPLPTVAVAEGTAVNIVVSSGMQSEKTIEVYIELPRGVSQDVTLKAYIDGTLHDTRTVNPSYVNMYQMTFTGTSGQQELTIQLNDQKYKVFTLNFDTGIPTETESYAFELPQQSSSSEPEDNGGDTQTGGLPIGTGGGITNFPG